MDASLQQSSVLDAAAQKLVDYDHQAILTQWSELFRIGLLAWGLNLSNPNPAFFHLTDHGRQALRNLTRDPSNPDGYMRHLDSIEDWPRREVLLDGRPRLLCRGPVQGRCGGQIDRNQVLLRSIPIQKKIFELAEPHLDSPHREVRNLATALFAYNDRLFTFLEHEGAEPTNKSVERALPTGVQWRKVCFGNRSENGELATSRLLTVAETRDLQRLNILAYLSAAIACHRRRQRAASLLHR